MKIAVVGAGFCGLATAWNLLQNGSGNKITLIDSLGIGKGASGVAAGLLHAYAGSQAKKNIRADEGLAATLKLLEIAKQNVESPIVINKGLIRLAVTEKQKADFSHVASLYSDVHWLSTKECCQRLNILQNHPGIYIDTALVIDCEKYLEGLWNACARAGVSFEKKKIQTLVELNDYDIIIVTMGAAVKSLPELNSLKVTPIKGQVLDLNWPDNIPAPILPIASQAYLIMQPEGNKCIAGATYERHFTSELPELDSALHEIMPKLQAFLPAMNSGLVLGCRAGIRASAPRHQPLLAQINAKTWVLTGMGSKGLLYHALYAEELVNAIKR